MQRGNLQAVILEGANLGLQSEQEKQSRLVNDKMWAERFFHEKPETVLEDWYKQLNLTLIPDAGHNAHLENPTYFAEKIENIVLKIAQP